METRFSLVQIVIIVVVLGLVGTRVVPRFAGANPEFRINRLVDGLQEMRAQLDVYRAQHRGQLPDARSFDVFQTAMTKKTGRYGPYVKKIPVNPFNKLNTVRFDGEPAGAGKAGWRLDTRTGLFQADNGAGYSAL